ncbi:MAG: ribonuclease H-like domain-containing protein [Myxococcaceae bacterium]|nr:ribonuclease H-like domain-containing protein [Myxococcaceae bacterium]
MDLKTKLSRLTAPVRRTPAQTYGASGPHARAEVTAQAAVPMTAPGAPPPPAAARSVATEEAGPGSADVPDRAADIRRRLAALTAKSHAVQTAARAVQGRGAPFFETRETPHGPIHLRDTLFPADHRHGRAPVRAALEAEPGHLAALALDESLRGVDPRGMLLIDTETTGLAGGTGTLPFVIGLGWFEGECLRVQQLVLRRPGEEAPMLRALEERLAVASCLVSYNGKTFDWPLLRNRFVMYRLKAPDPKAHFDLLHCARRIFKWRDGGAKLTHIEERILGHVRRGDVPGEQIPELYFRYLRTGNDALVAPVLDHNAHDMVLLAALLGWLARQFRDATADDPRDQLGYATVAARAGDAERALAFARSAAIRGAADRVLCAEALALAAHVSRRKGDVLAAVDALRAAVRVASGELLASLHLELAKLYEHRLGDVGRALDHARYTQLAEGPTAHRRRLERLEAKWMRSAPDARQLGLMVPIRPR